MFLHQARGKQQIHVRTQRWGIQKCVHSFPQAHAGSQKRFSWYQLTHTHKMASMRLSSNSETLSARGSEKQTPPKMLQKVLGSVRHCPFCFFKPRENYEQNNGNASDPTSRRECTAVGGDRNTTRIPQSSCSNSPLLLWGAPFIGALNFPLLNTWLGKGLSPAQLTGQWRGGGASLLQRDWLGSPGASIQPISVGSGGLVTPIP